jgi:hypothetical protein
MPAASDWPLCTRWCGGVGGAGAGEHYGCIDFDPGGRGALLPRRGDPSAQYREAGRSSLERGEGAGGWRGGWYWGGGPAGAGGSS